MYRDISMKKLAITVLFLVSIVITLPVFSADYLTT